MKHGTLLALLLVCLALAACQTSPQATVPSFGETWYSLRDGELRYGVMHVVVRPRADGGTDVLSTSTTRIELFGKLQEHSTETAVEVDSELRLVRFSSTNRSASGSQSVRGEVHSEGLIGSTEQDGHTTVTSLPATAVEGLVVDAVLGPWLLRAGQRVNEPPRRVRLLSTDTGTVTEVSIRLTKRDTAGSTWEIDLGNGLPPARIQFDGDGSLVEQFVRIPPVHWVRCSGTEAADFSHRRIPDRELLVFPSDVPLPSVARLESVTLELSWVGIPPNEFEWTDSRQRVLSLESHGEKHIARVELRRPSELTCRYSLLDGVDAAPSSERDSLRAALGDDNFVQPTHAQISAKAREIVAGETSALTAARKLSTWVNAHIQSSMIAETLSGPEVLERRVGKCTEYSTLFASLARAVGIPTRLALGQRRFPTATGDNWGGHMWNEIFIGEWIPVDASVDEVGGSTALLKFVHSNTVEGTQSLRWKLTESLAIAIVDHTLVDLPASSTTFETGLVGLTYTSAEHGFRLDLPNDSWKMTPIKKGDVTTFRLQPPTGVGASAQIHLVVFPVVGKLQPKSVLLARLQSHQKSLTAFTVGADAPVEIAGCSGHRQQCEGTLAGDEPSQRRVTEVIWTRNDQGFLFTLSGRPRTHDAQLANIDAILASFQWLDG